MEVSIAMQAIETVFRGYKFRSRLEARYAIVFDELRFDWTYEPEGFHLPSGSYLPDFHITDVPFWLEVKGTRPTAEEVTAARELCETTRESVWVCDGDLMHFESDDMRLRHQCFHWIEADDALLRRIKEDPDTVHNRVRVERILLLGGEVSVQQDVLPGHVAHLWQRPLLQVVMAADKMRSARFERDDAPSRTSFMR